MLTHKQIEELVEIRNSSRCEAEVICKLLETSWGKKLFEKNLDKQLNLVEVREVK